jgi:hypothetical protein
LNDRTTSLRDILNAPNSQEAQQLDDSAKEVITAVFLMKARRNKPQNDQFRQKILESRKRQCFGLRESQATPNISKKLFG